MPYSHLRPSKARLFWEKWSHTFAYAFFCLILIIAVALVRTDLQNSQEASERQTAALLQAQAAVSEANERARLLELKASCERGNLSREAINSNAETIRFILEFFYEGDPIPQKIDERLKTVKLVDCSQVGNQ